MRTLKKEVWMSVTSKWQRDGRGKHSFRRRDGNETMELLRAPGLAGDKERCGFSVGSHAAQRLVAVKGVLPVWNQQLVVLFGLVWFGFFFLRGRVRVSGIIPPRLPLAASELS